MTAQIRKSAKECDCCRKESDPQSCCSALLAFSCACGLQRGPLKAGGHRPARERMLHTVRIIARFRAVTSHLWSAGALYETVSPHLCLAVFCPAVNKASSSCLPTLIHKGRSRSQTESETSELDLPLADNSSRAHWLVTKGSHFWMTGSSVPFQKFTSLIHRSWHSTSLPWNEIGVFLVEQLFFFFFQQTSSADSSGWEWGWRGGWSFPCFSAPGLRMNRAEKTRIEALSIWSSSRKLTTLNCSRAGRRTTERSRSIGFWSHPPWPFTTHQSQSIVRQDFPSVNKKRGSDTLEGPSLASGTEVRFNRVTALNPPSQLACPCLDCPPWTRFLFSQSITLSS